MTEASMRPPGYVLRERIGTGMTSEVYRAERAGRPGSVVAVKCLRTTAGADELEQLQREADILTGLAHPSLLRVLDIIMVPHGIALILPYAPGGSLAQRIDRGPLPAITVADLGARLARALATLHDAGLLHGDLKPENILFDAEGQPLVADLGASRLRNSEVPLIGTWSYLAPEIRAGGPPTVASDLFALGTTLRAATVSPPDALAGILDALCAPDAGTRPATAARVATLLEEAEHDLLEAGRLQEPPGRPILMGSHPAGSNLPTRTRSDLPATRATDEHAVDTTSRIGERAAAAPDDAGLRAPRSHRATPASQPEAPDPHREAPGSPAGVPDPHQQATYPHGEAPDPHREASHGTPLLPASLAITERFGPRVPQPPEPTPVPSAGRIWLARVAMLAVLCIPLATVTWLVTSGGVR